MAYPTDPVTGRPARTPTDTTQTSSNPEAIADDIRETRAEMTETLDAIGEKLDPSRLVDQAKEVFTTSARDAGASLMDAARDSSVMDTIKANPIPAMAVGLSLAWFVSKLGESESARYRADQYAATGDPMYAPVYGASRQRPQGPGSGTFNVDAYERRAYGPASGGGASGDGLLDKASDAFDSAKDAVTGAAQDAKEAVVGTAHDAKRAATHAADAARERGSDFASAAPGRQDFRRYERQAEGWLDRQMNSNPLAVGAVALAAGALVGLSIPETRAEDELMGTQAEAVRQRALSAAESHVDTAQEAISEVADEAKAKAEKVAATAKQKATKVGDEATSKAKNVAGKAEAEAKDTAKTAKAEAESKAAAAKDAAQKAAKDAASGGSSRVS